LSATLVLEDVDGAHCTVALADNIDRADVYGPRYRAVDVRSADAASKVLCSVFAGSRREPSRMLGCGIAQAFDHCSIGEPLAAHCTGIAGTLVGYARNWT
jgi:hypothetical protein